MAVSGGQKEAHGVTTDARELLTGWMPAAENNAVEVDAGNGGSRWCSRFGLEGLFKMEEDSWAVRTVSDVAMAVGCYMYLGVESLLLFLGDFGW